jgi:lipoyl(octanoyl) transferase
MDENGHTPAAEQMRVCELGLVPYEEALALQRRLCLSRQSGEAPDTLLLLEHPPVLTRGRRSANTELLHEQAFYRERGIELLDTDRGGRITYHGPGQLVGYLIMRIADVGVYLRTMERALIAALAREGIDARSRHQEGPDFTGAWVAERKIASIGVHVSRGVTTHGFAINVSNDLEPFSLVVPCGLRGVAMTTVRQELSPGTDVREPEFRRLVASELCTAFRRRLHRVGAAELHSGWPSLAGSAV